MLIQAILLDEREGMDSMSLLRLMAPLAALMLVPAIVVLEPGALGAVLRLLHTHSAFGMLLVANSVLAYIVNYTSFKVTKCTSPLSLQVRNSLLLQRTTCMYVYGQNSGSPIIVMYVADFFTC